MNANDQGGSTAVFRLVAQFSFPNMDHRVRRKGSLVLGRLRRKVSLFRYGCLAWALVPGRFTPIASPDAPYSGDIYGYAKGDMLIFYVMSRGRAGEVKRSEVLQGTLDLMTLKTLHAMGPLHGFRIARRIEQVSEDVLQLNEGTVYTSLLRLQQQGWIDSDWGTSENNRKARFYSITRSGMKQLARETENWNRISGVIGRVLSLEGQK